MSNSRRVIAALLAVFLLQLSLPLGVTACAMHHGASASVQAAGHDMSDMGNMGGCELPAAPGQCETMAACAVTALPSLAVRVPQREVVTARVLPEASSSDSRLAGPPELPPPRA